ncbi:MAG: DNA-processing protein DprA [Saprospiraceae bacterium]
MHQIKNDLKYQIALTRISGIGNITAKTLINHCGNAEAVFNAKKKDLTSISTIGDFVANAVQNANVEELSKYSIDQLSKHRSVKPIFYTDEDYPQRLKHHDASPLLLYADGSADLNAHRTVAIIGTRNCTEYGVMQCERLVEGLKEYGVQIISGLAYGIDGCAHRKAVKIGISNLAILGSGLDVIYPPSHDKLAQKIKTNGAIISQFDFGTGPDRQNFPIRNQVVAAMSDVVVVIQSKKSGGSMITAEYANNMNKDVFAIPGRIGDEVSEGCNNLIKQHKANLLQTAKDIGYVMRWEPQEKVEAQLRLFEELNESERTIVEVLKKKDAIDIDTLHFTLERPLSMLSSQLLSLEFKGIVKSLPGKRYALI